MKARLVIVDDEPRMAEILAMVLRRAGFEVATFQDGAAACESVAADPADLVLTDLKMPRVDGLEVLRRVRGLDADVPVILMTAHATVATAVQAIRDGAFDYLEKPVDNDHLVRLVTRALEVTALSRENRYLRAELGADGGHRVIAESEAMRGVLRLARRVAASRSTVLITGESGTGKEVVARRVHFWSERVGAPFVAINVKAVPETLFESELFGHARGAFTGAASARPGLFERAHGGTLFLDEIGELPEPLQAKLLRVLQEREVTRVGDDRVRPVDVRLLVATHRDLAAEVAAGRFREDLFFRLSVIPLHVPPLRERRDDVLPLASHFLERFAGEACRELRGFTEAARAWLLGHPWPGNVRELSNAIERGVVMADGDWVDVEDLRGPVGGAAGARAALERSHARDESLQAVLDRATAEHVRATLEAVRGVKAEAARRLGVDRSTLYRLMARHGIDEEPQ